MLCLGTRVLVFRLVALLVLGTGAGGCSVDDRGMLFGTTRYFRNEDDSGRAVRVEAWGVHLSTYGVDRGITVGHLDKTYFFAGDSLQRATHLPTTRTTTRPTGEASGVIELEAGRLLPVDRQVARGWQRGEPLGFIGSSQGLGMHVSSFRFGITLGVWQGALVALPKDGSRVLLLRTSSKRPDESVLSYHVKGDEPK